jgi:hypothetical protein
MNQFLISFRNPAMCHVLLDKIMKGVLLIIPVITVVSGCSKSSSSAPVTPPSCTTDICILTSQTWRIGNITDHCDLGDYTATTTELATIPWATFLFNRDSTVSLTGGGHGNYTYTDSTKSLVLIFNALPLQFTVTSLAPSSLAFTGAKVQMNPQTDTSPEASYAIKSIAGDLHDNYGVDTSMIHYVQASFIYH